jgi:hypothetical protein
MWMSAGADRMDPWVVRQSRLAGPVAPPHSAYRVGIVHDRIVFVTGGVVSSLGKASPPRRSGC